MLSSTTVTIATMTASKTTTAGKNRTSSPGQQERDRDRAHSSVTDGNDNAVSSGVMTKFEPTENISSHPDLNDPTFTPTSTSMPMPLQLLPLLLLLPPQRLPLNHPQ